LHIWLPPALQAKPQRQPKEQNFPTRIIFFATIIFKLNNCIFVKLNHFIKKFFSEQHNRSLYKHWVIPVIKIEA